MKIMKPTRNNVLIAFQKEENKTESGLILTGTVDHNNKKGVVLGRGPECDTVQVEDKVIGDWSKASDIGGGQVIIKETDIYAIID